jgi:hypothetical protein
LKAKKNKGILTANQNEILSGRKKCSRDTERKNRDRARARTKSELKELANIAEKFPDAIQNEDIVNLVRAKLKHGQIENWEMTRSRFPKKVDEKRHKVSCVQNDGVLRNKKGVPIDRADLAEKTIFANKLQAVFENLALMVPDAKDVAGFRDFDFPTILDKYRVIRLCQKGKKVTPFLHHCLNMEDENVSKSFQELMSFGIVKSSKEVDTLVNCLVLPLGKVDLKKINVIILEKQD